MTPLTYPPPDNFWQHFEFQSTLTTALVVSLLTTLISYQLTAIFTDLILGWKPRRTARVHTFHTLLLSRRSSPLAVLNALLRRDALTRLYLRRHLATNDDPIPLNGTAIPRDDARVKFAAVFLLMLVMTAPPVVNMFAVGVTLESDRAVSFSEANFGGLFLGVYADENGLRTDVLERELVTEDCDGYAIEPLAFDAITARVTVCRNTVRPGTDTTQTAYVVLLLEDGVRVLASVKVGKMIWERHYTGYLRTGEGESLLLKAGLHSDQASPLVKGAMEAILDVCGAASIDDAEVVVESDVKKLRGQEFIAGRGPIDCAVESGKAEEAVMAAFQVFDRGLTLVRTDDMMVKVPTGTSSLDDFVNAKDKQLLTRRTRVLGIGILGIVAGMVVVGRAIVGLLFNNDVNDGIERIVKERLGLEYCESLLRDGVGGTVVQYNMDDRHDGRIDDDY